jgi:hypothetical protein
MPPHDPELHAKLNTETTRIGWQELERHFAHGSVVTVDAGLDLVEVAARMAQDDKAAVQNWLSEDRIRRTTAEEAQRWSQSDAQLWCVVVAPWVLVQEERQTH